MRFSIPFLLFFTLIFSSCSSDEDEVPLLEELYPFGEYSQLVFESSSETDTVQINVDLSSAIFSEDGYAAVVSNNLFSQFVWFFNSIEEGLCIDLSVFPSPDTIFFEDYVDSLEYLGENCIVILKYPAKDGQTYSFSYLNEDVNYTYEVQVEQAIFLFNDREYTVFKYTIPDGKDPGLRTPTEVYYTPELGIVRLTHDHITGLTGDEMIELIQAN